MQRVFDFTYFANVEFSVKIEINYLIVPGSQNFKPLCYSV